MGVPLNHPFLWDLQYKPPPTLGTPILRNPQKTAHFTARVATRTCWIHPSGSQPFRNPQQNKQTDDEHPIF